MKKKHLLFFALILAFFSGAGWAQTITIGTGTSTARDPFNYYYGYGRNAIIYTAAEIGSANNPKSITKVRFYSTLSSGFVTGPTVIYVQARDSAVENLNLYANKIATATQVYSGTPTWVNGWNEIDIADFTVPTGKNFEIIIECNKTGSGTGTGSGNLYRYSTTVGSMHLYWQKDDSPPVDGGALSTSRPNIQLDTGAVIANDVTPLSISPTGLNMYTQGTTNIPMSGVIKNLGGSVTSNTVTVIRTIAGTGYSSTVIVPAGLAAGATAPVTFSDFTGWTANTLYTIKDSVYMPGDQNPGNDTLSRTFTPAFVKTALIYYRNFAVGQASRDSLIAAINANGTFVNDYDVINADSYTGTLRPWKTIFVCFDGYGNGLRWSSVQRDSMKAFLDNSSPADKKTLIYFDYDAGYYNDPVSSGFSGAAAADSIFYRKYLKAQYYADDWYTPFPNHLFKGMPGDPMFGGFGTDSISGLYPDYIKAVNGGTPAFIPASESGDGDTCNAVYFSGTGPNGVSVYNSFLMTNAYSYFRTRAALTDAPVNVFNTIVNWAQINGGQVPVELASFTSAINNRDVQLKWSTVSEQNSAGFDIERKTSVTGWTKIGNVQGAGTVNTARNYSFSDNNLSSGRYNYRLKQIDYNGSFKYYALANEVIVGAPDKFNLAQNYPNPFNPATNINYDLPFDSKVSIKIFDMTGREISSLVNQVQPAGYYSVNFNASNLASGIYFYSINAEGGSKSFVKSMKMVLVK